MAHNHRYTFFYCTCKYLFRKNLRFVLQIAKGQLDGIIYISENMELLQQGITRIMKTP